MKRCSAVVVKGLNVTGTFNLKILGGSLKEFCNSNVDFNLCLFCAAFVGKSTWALDWVVSEALLGKRNIGVLPKHHTSDIETFLLQKHFRSFYSDILYYRDTIQ